MSSYGERAKKHAREKATNFTLFKSLGAFGLAAVQQVFLDSAPLARIGWGAAVIITGTFLLGRLDYLRHLLFTAPLAIDGEAQAKIQRLEDQAKVPLATKQRVSRLISQLAIAPATCAQECSDLLKRIWFGGPLVRIHYETCVTKRQAADYAITLGFIVWENGKLLINPDYRDAIPHWIEETTSVSKSIGERAEV